MDNLIFGQSVLHYFLCMKLIFKEKYSFFGFLLVAKELGYPKILDEFGFLKTFLGRGLFYIL